MVGAELPLAIEPLHETEEGSDLLRLSEIGRLPAGLRINLGESGASEPAFAIAEIDQHPGFLNGVLSLILSGNDIESEFEAGSSYLPNKADWFEGRWQGLGRPGELAEFAAFMCSDRNSFMNGEIVIVDGGAVT